jgi:hypothetical protein
MEYNGNLQHLIFLHFIAEKESIIIDKATIPIG